MTPRRLMLLDSASLYFRAFYGVPERTAADGTPNNALRGFADMIATLFTTYEPTDMVACWDNDWRPAFRVEAIPSYKTHRLDPKGRPGAEIVPDGLVPQVPMILDVLAAAGIATAGAEGLEADDVLGTLSTREQQDDVVVVSGDRDLLQLVSDEQPPVKVFYVGRGLAKAELFGPAEVAAKYGVPVANAGPAYADLAALRGDASDGLPGVKGIGEKSASSLIMRFGSLEALRDAALDPDSDLAQGVRAKLAAAADYLDAAATVVRVVRDADIMMSGDDDLPTEPADTDRLLALGVELNAENPVGRLVKAMRNR